MEIVRVLNNNAVMPQEKGKMTLVMGLSIGFKKRPGDSVEKSRIEKSFVLSSPETCGRLHDLLLCIPDTYLDFAGDMVDYARQQLARELNDNLLITLTDHIYSSLERYRKGIALKNPLLWDIQRFYQNEFAVALEIVDKINRAFGVNFESDEAGFVAFHLAAAQEDATGQVVEVTRLMHNLLEIVFAVFPGERHDQSNDYQRLITHLKFFSQRVLARQVGRYQGEEDLLTILKEKYPAAYDCAGKLCVYASEQYQYQPCAFDLLSLTMHIARMAGNQAAP